VETSEELKTALRQEAEMEVITRDAQAAKRFFSKTLAAPHTITPSVITVDKNATSPRRLVS